MPGLSHIQYGDHYPLVNPSNDIKYLITDLTVSYENTSWEYNLPLSISYFNKTTGLLKLKNSNNVEVFSSTANSINTWGGRYKIFHWTTAHTVVKMAINTEIDTPSIIEPQSAVIDLRAVFLVPPHITAINGYTGNICFKSGYNMSTASEDLDEEPRQGVQINMDAIAGAGKGVNPSSTSTTESSGLKYLAGAKPDDNGSVFLRGEGGPQVSAECHSISIGNSNEPCCHCDDMENLGKYMNDVSREYKILGGLAKWIYNEYTKTINKWNGRCSDADGTGTGSSSEANGTVKPAEAIHLWLVPGNCPYVTLKIQITNLNKVSWCDLQLAGTFTPAMCRVSEIYTTTTASEGEMLVWVNDVVQSVSGTYAECTYTANRYPVRLRDDTRATSCEFGTVRWQGNIAPGESVFYQAEFKLDVAQPSRTDYTIEFHIDTIEVSYADGTSADLWHDQNTIGCTFGSTQHGTLARNPLLNGKHKITATIDCDARIDDTVENLDRVDDIRDEIYDIRQRYWPCEE